MKSFLCILLSVLLPLSLSACSNASNTSSTFLASEVVITLPNDDTVNGYRISDAASANSMPNSISGDEVSVSSNVISSNSDKVSADYCGNKNSKVFHKASCSSVKNMKESNKYFADRQTLVSENYSPCGNCNP